MSHRDSRIIKTNSVLPWNGKNIRHSQARMIIKSPSLSLDENYRVRPCALTFGRVQRRNQHDPRGPRDKDGSDYCHTRYSRMSARFFREFREISRRAPSRKSTRAGVQMQTDLSYGVQQEQHDTHASWLPRACLFRVFTSHRDNCDPPDILILSHCTGTSGGCRRTRRVKCCLSYCCPCALSTPRCMTLARRFSRIALSLSYMYVCIYRMRFIYLFHYHRRLLSCIAHFHIKCRHVGSKSKMNIDSCLKELLLLTVCV